ncbi:MAG: endolytic transglycosylase MltG [Phycisphaerae bacterium]|nr:endolytic transglycosylase MltG [Gemmatimonadaceae bacterium]
MSAARRNRGGTSRFIKWGVAIAFVAFGWHLWGSYAGTAATGDPVSARVMVLRGASVREVSDSLARAGAIRSARLFRTYAAIGGRDRLIKPGAYRFQLNTGWKNSLEALVSGKSVVHSVTIPEGYDMRQITPLLAKALGVPEDSIEAAASDTSLQRKLDLPIKSIEGYLFPATYAFPDQTTAKEAVSIMVAAFEATWKDIPNAAARLQAMAITRHDAMSMASIIETEAKRPEERAIISAVYWNRVKRGMKLQADPTVQYALPSHVARVLYKDLEVDSKYNTYKYSGLPPGPIASPGRASIEAALNPAAVPYLYFVAHPDGHHEFRTTFAEHEKAIAMMRRERKAATAGNPK